VEYSCEDHRKGYKIYSELRTMHAVQSIPNSEAIFLYRKESYDFDKEVLSLYNIKKCSIFMTIGMIILNDVRIIELHEPLFLREVPINILYMLIISIKRKLFKRSRRTKMVTYAIENVDILRKVRSHLPKHLSFVNPIIRYTLMKYAIGFDKIAFGTESAKKEYLSVFPKILSNVETKDFSPFEPLCPTCVVTPQNKIAKSIVFLGLFDDRKGIEDLMRAWPAIREYCDGAQLTLIGKGPLLDKVLMWAGSGVEKIDVIVDPARSIIHEILARSEFLVLPSVSDDRWREQIGLPLIEALSHKCRVVTTRATGISNELRNMGHLIIESLDRDYRAVSEFINTEFVDSELHWALPVISGRQQAEMWLWE
jgi:glycosyltransferase involved in cell wall biosynthesis